MSQNGKPNTINKGDFSFVQLDKKIHDIKFETKPTTFFADAFKRFTKNKSSVFAGMIIGVLSLLAVAVPILNTNPIDRPLFEARFLPPKWPGFDALGLVDGTTEEKNIIIDTLTDPENPTPVGYKLNAIVGDIEIYDTFSNYPSPYATGGYLALRSDTRDNDGYFYSVGNTLNTYNNQYVIDATIASNLEVFGQVDSFDATYRLIAYVEYSIGTPTLVPLTEFSTEVGSIHVDTLSATIQASRPEGVVGFTFRTKVGLQLQTTPSGAYPVLLLETFKLSRSHITEDTLFANVNFTSGNEVMLRDSAQDPSLNRWSVNYGSKSVYQSVLPRGNFRYDNYLAAFGEVVRAGIGQSVIQQYIDNGWISYDFNVGPSSFVLLNDVKSPVREVISQQTQSFGNVSVNTLTARISIYREKGFDAIPYYLFGTDVNGYDFFKIVFSGLGTSLLLGIFAAAINVTIGMLWGALSGYYGGWIDIAMERFTEILGGIPSIVLLTLTILLLGSNFGTFLLALTLTGWIGTAALTRSQFYRYKRREYILASRTLGAKDWRLISRHILPNSIGPIVTSSVLIIPGVIFSEASISFLGLGLQGLPSLGVALSRSQEYLQIAPYLTLFGGLIISLLLISFNLFGNGLRDAFNPSLKGISE